MDQEFDFFLTSKDLGKVLRHERRFYYLIWMIILALLIADGIALGLTIKNEINWLYIAAIPVLSLCYGAVGFLCFTNGGIQIYKQCHASFKRDNIVELSCEREIGLRFDMAKYKPGLKKTMSVTKIKEYKGYWVIYEKKRQWAVLPKDIPLNELIHLPDNNT